MKLHYIERAERRAHKPLTNVRIAIRRIHERSNVFGEHNEAMQSMIKEHEHYSLNIP